MRKRGSAATSFNVPEFPEYHLLSMQHLVVCKDHHHTRGKVVRKLEYSAWPAFPLQTPSPDISFALVKSCLQHPYCPTMWRQQSAKMLLFFYNLIINFRIGVRKRNFALASSQREQLGSSRLLADDPKNQTTSSHIKPTSNELIVNIITFILLLSSLLLYIIITIAIII